MPLFKGPTSKGMEGNGSGEEKVKGKEGERRREGFGPPKNFGVAPPMSAAAVQAGVRRRCRTPEAHVTAASLTELASHCASDVARQ